MILNFVSETGMPFSIGPINGLSSWLWIANTQLYSPNNGTDIKVKENRNA